jgi:hypothetical protein
LPGVAHEHAAEALRAGGSSQEGLSRLGIAGAV